LFRQNTILNDFVNFLKARGRFRDIEFIDNTVHATPRIPDLPTLVFYIEENRLEHLYTLEIHGNESTVMNREIQEFFELSKLGLKKVKSKFYLTTVDGDSLIVEAEGIGLPFETMIEQMTTLFDVQDYSITNTQKTLVFSPEVFESGTQAFQSQTTMKQKTPRHTISPKTSTAKSQDIISKSVEKNSSTQQKVTQSKPQILPHQKSFELSEIDKSSYIEENLISSKETLKSPHLSSTNDLEASEIVATSPSFSDNDFMDFKEKEFSETSGIERDSSAYESSTEDLEADLFHPKPPQKSYSSDIKPYLKQTTSLFRRDNWEDDLPSEFEMEILERTYSRIKHRTKPEILAKDFNIPVDKAETYLRNLISKGLLRTQVGWYIIKKSHLPFFKKTFSNGDKKKKKKKSPRISRVGEGLTPEEISTIKAIKDRPNLKAQSNLLTRPTGLKQSVLKEVLRNLVEKGILRVSYGWYILKDKHILEHKRGSILDQVKEQVHYKMPRDLDLTPSEEKVIQALLQRPHYKAQSNLLTPDLKLPKEQIKQVLRELVEKDICTVKFGWYCLKDPKKFL
jgi:DNA-binding MarR family transcriptional regulator